MKLFLFLLLIPAVMLGNEIYSLMNYTPSSDFEAQKFCGMGFDIVQIYPDGSIDFVANSTDRRVAIENGFCATTRVSDMESFYRARNGVSRSMGGFYTWDETSAWIDSLVSANPAITCTESIGDTYQNRPQRVIKLSVNNTFYNDDPAMPNAWYDGLIHAREGAAMRNMRYWAMWLCSNYQRNGYSGYQATWVLENREIWVLPVNNVDGWVYNESTSPGGGGMHRKNMNWSAGGDGIDLNRNWSVDWGGSGSSSSPSSSTYRGTAPLSEPESSNIDSFWQTYTPTQMHSTHCYSNALIYPWGFTSTPTTHAAAYSTQGEMMVKWATGEEHYTSYNFGTSAGNTRDHAYGIYGAMSWNHETGASFAGFWPSASEVVKLSRRNLRSYLLTAFLAGCPYNPHEPGVSVLDEIGTVSVPFTIDWTDATNADSYALQKLSGYQILLDDQGDSGPFDRVNWIMTTSQHHSGTQCYVSDGTGQMTWQQSVTIPSNGGGRISFWSMQDITPQSYQGAFSYSPDGGTNWYYLQTFGRDDMNWSFNIHELDEFQGQTIQLRWESYGSSSSCKLYIDDIKVDVWDVNELHADDIASSEYTVTALNNGDYYFRVWAIDNEFGPGWASEPVSALVSTSGIADTAEGIVPGVSSLGLITPNPVFAGATIPVTIVPSDLIGAELSVYNISGRKVADLSSDIIQPGFRNVLWDTSNVSSGIHFVRLKTASGVTVQRLVIAGR